MGYISVLFYLLTYILSVGIGDVVSHLYGSNQTEAIGRFRGSDSTVDQSRGTDELSVFRWMHEGRDYRSVLVKDASYWSKWTEAIADLEGQTKSRSISRDR